MTHPRYFRLAAAALVIASAFRDCRAQNAPRVVVFDRVMLGAVRALYAGMRTEFAGCLYGRAVDDSIVVQFFVPANVDPRTASDSEVTMRTCPILHEQLVAILHSHMRAGSLCLPSGFPNGATDTVPPDSLTRDRAVLYAWMQYGARFAAIICARGDTIMEFSLNHQGKLTGAGWYGLPPLDSLYPPGHP